MGWIAPLIKSKPGYFDRKACQILARLCTLKKPKKLTGHKNEMKNRQASITAGPLSKHNFRSYHERMRKKKQKQKRNL